jgi:hypothetical protein
MKTKTNKKIVVINLGDVRNADWEDNAELGLELLKKMRSAGFKPSTEAPYISDGGDVPLVITVEMEDSPYRIKKNVELLSSIVGDDVSVYVMTEKEWDEYRHEG